MEKIINSIKEIQRFYPWVNTVRFNLDQKNMQFLRGGNEAPFTEGVDMEILRAALDEAIELDIVKFKWV